MVRALWRDWVAVGCLEYDVSGLQADFWISGMEGSMLARVVSFVQGLPKVPLAFMGFGMHRAWFELAFTMPRVPGGETVLVHDWLDLAMIATLLLCSVRARRVSPLCSRGALVAGAPMLLIAATGLAYLGVFVPETALALRWAASIMGGVGIALMILMWCERYARLTPGRFLLYYASMMLAGAAVIWIYRGFVPAWQPWMVGLLPLVSIGVLLSSRDGGEGEEPAEEGDARFTFPWKPLLVVALYSFAFSLQYTSDAVPGLYSSPGTVVSALVVVGALLLTRGHIGFETVYSAWLPVMSALFLLVPAGGGLPGVWADFFNCLGYGANEIFIATMIGSIAYRYGVNAVWLYGAELGARFLVLMLGRELRPLFVASGLGAGLPVIVAVVLATVLVVSEIKIDSNWGIDLVGSSSGEQGEDAVAKRNDVGTRCAELARTHGLTQREGEVLLLLAQRKTTAEIEAALFIANGTAKAHVSHVYQKLGVHTREGLLELLGE